VAPGAVFGALLSGAFGNWLALTDTIVKAMPLVFTGLAVSVAFTGGLWNIGAEGQLLMGATAACAVGAHLAGWPAPLALAVTLAAGSAAGAIWSGSCGLLKVRYGVNEVISTIMLNYVAIEVVSWAVHGPLMEPTRALPVSAPVAAAATFRHFFPPSQLNAGLLLAAALAVACQVWIFHTSSGFELRAIGKNPRASAFFRIPVAQVTILAMTVSGALAGMAGAVQVCAITHRLYEQFSPGWGYEAIAVALVARLNPLALLITALFFGALDNGSQSVQLVLGISPVLAEVIQAIVIFLLLAFDAVTLWKTAPAPAPSATETPADA
jgi:general nucleoside transport system permease protein